MRQWVKCSLVVLSACAGDGPPTLPGEEAPRCTLAKPRSFLVDKIDPPGPRPVDLSVPTDGDADNDALPYRFVHAAVELRLDDALAAALSEHHILWIVRIQECQNDPYVRIALHRGAYFIEASPLDKVMLVDEPVIWSVGRSDGAGTLNAAMGVGTVPFAAPLDAQSMTEETAWFPAHMVDVEAQLTGEVLVGDIALAIDTATARPEVSAAIARTMTVARQDEPNCPPTCSSEALRWLQGLDANVDGQFTGDEVEQSGYLEAFGFYPKLDLLARESGELVFWPNRDGEAESLGNGFGFQAHEIETD